MRSLYATPDRQAASAEPGSRAYERRVLQIVTLAYWGPCCLADLWLLRRGGVDGAGYVFWLLFREALVFLALWFAAAVAHGLMWGSREPKGPDPHQLKKLRSRLAAGFRGYVAPTRGNRGQ